MVFTAVKIAFQVKDTFQTQSICVMGHITVRLPKLKHLCQNCCHFEIARVTVWVTDVVILGLTVTQPRLTNYCHSWHAQTRRQRRRRRRRFCLLHTQTPAKHFGIIIKFLTLFKMRTTRPLILPPPSSTSQSFSHGSPSPSFAAASTVHRTAGVSPRTHSLSHLLHYGYNNNSGSICDDTWQ